MEELKTIIKTNNNFNSYSNRNKALTSIAIAIEEQDKLINSIDDLIEEGYRLWFIKRLKAIGKERFVEAAYKARNYGKDKKRLFSYLVS